MISISRRIDAARRAFDRNDVASAAALHDPERVGGAVQRETSSGASIGTYIGSMVYGGLDGIITTFAVVSGVAGADLGSRVILILGVGNLVADGFSMGVGDYLSTKSEREYYDREARRQAWEIDSFPEGQKAELRALYRKNGYDESDAERLVEVQSRDRERWVEAMMIQELGLVKEEANPLRNALATFVSFLIAGSMPLLVYLYGLARPIDPDTAFRVAIVLTAVALFTLGAAKVLITRLSMLRSGIEMLLVGGLAGIVAYIIGDLLQGVGG